MSFTTLVSGVLAGTLGDRPGSIKTVARWTGAGERTVKNWFAGTCAPRGHHFHALVEHCPEMLDAFLTSTGRSDRLAFAEVRDVREKLREVLAILDLLSDEEQARR